MYAGPSASSRTLDYSSFAHLVREAYTHLSDRAFLQAHPLTEMLYGVSPLASEHLHRTLVNAIDWLRPLGPVAQCSVEWRRYRHLQLRYLEGAGTEQIAGELKVSARQARRDHAEALEEVARLLWRRYVHPDQTLASARPDSLVRGMEGRPPSGRASRPANGLTDELTKLAEEAPPGPTSIDELVGGVVQTASRLAESRRVRIVAGIPPGLPSAKANRTVLRQLLLNLVVDLVTHPSTEAVGIHAEREAGSVVITVAVEMGSGEGDEERPQLDPASSASQADILSAEAVDICNRLAQSLSIGLRIEATTGGATAQVRLPVAEVNTLLVVDDNPDVGLLFRRYLVDTDYQVIQARSAGRALKLARELRPTVIFLDVLMPSADGWEILQSLRADPGTARLPVVICSVLPDQDLGLSLGVTDFLHKPITRASLLQTLARFRTAPADTENQRMP